MAWQGKSEIGRAQLQEAAALFEEIDDLNGLSDVQHELARLANYEGNYADGIHFASQSLANSERIHRPDWIAYALMERGVSYLCLGQYTESQHDLKRALAIFQEIGHPVGTAFALGELSWLIWATGGAQSAEAESQARQSLELARKVGYRLQIAYRLAQLAQFANDRRDDAEAERFAREGLAVATALNIPHFISQNLCMLAESAYQRREFAQARSALARAGQTAAAAGLYSRVLLTLYHAAILLWLATNQHEDLDPPERTEQQAQVLRWLELVVRHPASWSVIKEKASRQIAFVRAQAPQAVLVAREPGYGKDSFEQPVRHALRVLSAWEREEGILLPRVDSSVPTPFDTEAA
jgi:tetratricopeptide (TPR) repeat protein